MMVIAQIILLNVLWFASVLGAANGLLMPSVVAAFILLAVIFIYQGFDQQDGKIIGISVLMGLLIDGFLSNSGWLVYANHGHQVSFLPPVWIMLLWLGFGATIRTGMSWMFNNPLLGSVFMLIGAPLSYYSASRLGGVELLQLWPVMITIGISWLIYFLILSLIVNQSEQRDDVLA
jgi:hypothetical protein